MFYNRPIRWCQAKLLPSFAALRWYFCRPWMSYKPWIFDQEVLCLNMLWLFNTNAMQCNAMYVFLCRQLAVFKAGLNSSLLQAIRQLLEMWLATALLIIERKSNVLFYSFMKTTCVQGPLWAAKHKHLLSMKCFPR